MDLFLTLIMTASLFQGIAAEGRDASWLLDDDNYKKAKAVELSIDVNESTPEESIWRTHGLAMDGKYQFWKTNGDRVWFKKPIIETDANRTWYKPSLVYRMIVSANLFIHLKVYDMEQKRPHSVRAPIIRWGGPCHLGPHILKDCKQDNAHQIVINASDTTTPSRLSGPRISCPIRPDAKEHMFMDVRDYNDGVRNRRPEYKKIVDFKVTFNFAEESQPEDATPEGASGELDMDEETIECKRYLQPFLSILMGCVGLGLIIYGLTKAKNTHPEREEEKRTSEAEADIENPEEEGEC